MKKLLSLMLAVFMGAGILTGCGGSNQPAKDEKKPAEQQEQSADSAEIAMITDIGTIDDKSFNQGTWEGVKKYAEENNISHKYYKPTDKSDEAYMNAIELAIKGGAKVVVCPGYLFEVAIYNMQSKYPDVKFILIDGAPRKAQGEADSVADNTLSIVYAEQQAGYLAGYAAVKDGYKNLGFMGGVAVPAVIRYGYGFVQGAEDAAKEMNINDVNIKYTYVGNFDATPENETKASSWYSSGTQVIFACGGAVGNSVMKAAEKNQAKVIGVDVDQSSESDSVITSAMKNLQQSVNDALKSIYDGSFKGGQTLILGAESGNVLLPMDTSKFEKFTKDDYDAVYKKLVDGSLKIPVDTSVQSVDQLDASNVKIENIQ